jgi:hypothetical protein
MRRLFSLFVAALLLSPAVLARAQSSAAVGTWDMTIESPQGTRKAVLVIREEGGKLAAAMKSPQGERPLKSIEAKGSDIKMVMVIPFQGDQMEITYTGKVENDSMKGDADFGGLAPGTWSAVRQKEGAATDSGAAKPAGATDISGVWNFAVETAQGTGTPVFTFKQEGGALTGTYKGQLGEGPITGSVAGSDVKFSARLNVQGQDIVIVYTGKIESADTMKGKVAFGDLGEGTWTAKKKQ